MMDEDDEMVLDDEEWNLAGKAHLNEYVNIFESLDFSFYIQLQLRFITTKIVSSPQRRAKFRKIACSKYGNQPSTANFANSWLWGCPDTLELHSRNDSMCSVVQDVSNLFI